MWYKSLGAPGLKPHLPNILTYCALTKFFVFDTASRCVVMPAQHVCLYAGEHFMLLCRCTVHTLLSVLNTREPSPVVVLGAHRMNPCVCVCLSSRRVLLLPWGLRAHFLLCIVISFPVRSSQHRYISDKLHCKFSRPLAQRSIWDWFRMPCWAELEDQFEMDCSRQGANDTQCSLAFPPLLSSPPPWLLFLSIPAFSPLSPPLSFNCFTLVLCSGVSLSNPVGLPHFFLHQFLFMRPSALAHQPTFPFPLACLPPSTRQPGRTEMTLLVEGPRTAEWWTCTESDR